MQISKIEATSIEDAWFLSLCAIQKHGRVYTIDRGSFEKQQRRELDYVVIHIKHPATRPLEPYVNPSKGVPSPVCEGYLDSYLPYLMTHKTSPHEEYTYGDYLEEQIPAVIQMFKQSGYGTNQACMTIGDKTSITQADPPCLRVVDCRVQENKLHFALYFRSWECFNGLPANLGALQLLKEYMASEIGVGDGEIIATSKGLHLYDYSWPIVEKIIA